MNTTGELPTGTVTFVFTDIEGSTRLLTALGPRYVELLSNHHALIREHIAANHGTEVTTDGDSFFVVFEKAIDALSFSVDAQRELSATDSFGDSKVRVRMGIHTGDGTLSEGDYVGLDVHRAARVAAAGSGGQVLVSGAAAALLPSPPLPGVTLRDLGEHRLKDLPERLRIFDLIIDGLASDFPPIRSIGKGSLPDEPTSFVGRQEEIAKVSALLDDARLVTLTGPGGTGKTRLSIEVARHVQDQFTDGAWFVPLEEITESDLVPPAIARVMGVKEEPSRPQIDTLTEALAQRHALIILDNFEQVVGAARHVNRLLRDAPAPRILCSSREALRISGEQEFPVPPLGDEPAVRLFVQRARQIRPDFAPTDEDLKTIDKICRAVDRLPLAIELASARIRLFPLKTLLTRLTDRLSSLESSRRDLPDRQRTLRGAIEWSWELLDEVEREIFARLSVFAGGADLVAIEAIVDPDSEIIGDVIDVVGSLVEKNLVQVTTSAAGEARYRMLETIRAFAAEKAAADEHIKQVRVRHLAYFLSLAEMTDSEVGGDGLVATLELLDADHDNISAAIEWSLSSGQVAAGLRISGAIWRYWQQRGHLVEGRRLLERLRAAPPPDDAFARGRGQTGFGGIVYWQGEYELARGAYERAVEEYRAAGDRRNEAHALFDLGFTLSVVRDLEESERALDESERLFRELDDERGLLTVGEGKAALALVRHDFDNARDIGEALVEGYRRLDMTFRLADTLGLLAAVYLQIGDGARAHERWRQALSMWRAAGDLSGRLFTLEFGARIAFANGHFREAAMLLGTVQTARDNGERFLTPGDVIGLPDVNPMIRAALPPAEFERYFEEGRAWSGGDALAKAATLEIGP